MEGEIKADCISDQTINSINSYKLLKHRRSLATYSKLHPPRAPNSTLEIKASVVLEKVVDIGEHWKPAVM